MLSRRALQSSVRIIRHDCAATYATAAYTPRHSGRKEPQVERAIRIKSQQQRRESFRRSDNTGARIAQDRSRYQPSSRRADTDDQRSIRGLRFNIVQELASLVKDRRMDPEERFRKAEEIFEGVSNFTRRGAIMYNIMIRIALQAGKRQWAIRQVSEMKKNGVAPSALTCRSLFEGFSRTPNILDPQENIKMIKQLHSLFDDLEVSWRQAISGSEGKAFRRRDEEMEVDKESLDTSTARQYALSKQSMEREMLDNPYIFEASCERYLTFLLSIKALEEAQALIARAKELAYPIGASKWAKNRPASKLPYILSSRYLVELLIYEAEVSTETPTSILKAYENVVDGLLQQGVDIMKHGYGQEIGKEQHQFLQNDIDKLLYFAISTLDKYDIPEKSEIITKSLQDIYNNDRLASLPPIKFENTLNVAMDNIPNDESLVLKMFESALDYNDVEPQFQRGIRASHLNVNRKDVANCWTNAIMSALRSKGDLTKALDLMERASSLYGSRNSSSRFQPSFISTYVFGRLMRRCNEKLDWNSAIQVWRQFVQMGKIESITDEKSLQFFISRFLILASRLEKRQYDQETGKAAKDTIRYSRKALELLEGDIGLKNDLIWRRAQSVLEKSNLVKAPNLIKEGEGEVTSSDAASLDATACSEYVQAIRHVCRIALDTGYQGVDLADKDRTEKWKEMRSRAAQLRKIGEGLQDFDSKEAEWLRSGDNRKSSLALTDDDVRELLSR